MEGGKVNNSDLTSIDTFNGNGTPSTGDMDSKGPTATPLK
jgi:hypothetical protein